MRGGACAHIHTHTHLVKASLLCCLQEGHQCGCQCVREGRLTACVGLVSAGTHTVDTIRACACCVTSGATISLTALLPAGRNIIRQSYMKGMSTSFVSRKDVCEGECGFVCNLCGYCVCVMCVDTVRMCYVCACVSTYPFCAAAGGGAGV